MLRHQHMQYIVLNFVIFCDRWFYICIHISLNDAILNLDLNSLSFTCFLAEYVFFSCKNLQIQNEESVVLFLVTWALTEITRYSYYTFNLLNHLPYFIKWARWEKVMTYVLLCDVCEVKVCMLYAGCCSY